jgi:small subunit ribosomal protein S16
MPVRIRLRQVGAKKQRSFRVVVADSRSPRDGRFIETIGYYNAQKNPAEVHIDEERALSWLMKGAQPSGTARNLLERGGVWEKFLQMKSEKPAEESREESSGDSGEGVG